MPSVFSLGLGTILRFRGKDRCRVFNNLCTQDLRNLENGNAAETFVTDLKGRTFGHGIAFAIADDAYFISVPDQATRLVPHFDRYIIREDAQVTDESGNYSFWLFEDRKITSQVFGIQIEAVPELKSAKSIAFEGRSLMLVHAPWIGTESMVALVPTGDYENPFKKSDVEKSIDSDMSHREAWELARIKAFWPWYGVDMDERNLPQELNRNDHAISFNKGCYLGQETIARLDALGQVQKKLVRLRIATNQIPEPKTPIFADGKEIGSIVSGALDHSESICIAMAFVKRSHFKANQEVEVRGDSALVL